MTNQRQNLQRRAAELLSLLEQAATASGGVRQSLSETGTETLRTGSAEPFSEAFGGSIPVPGMAAEKALRAGTEREATAAPKEVHGGTAELSAVPPAGSGRTFLQGGQADDPLPGTAQSPLRAQAGAMEDIDRFFRRDSRRYDKCFAEEGEI